MAATPVAPSGPHLDVDPDGIARITFDDPTRKVNVLTEPVMSGLALLLGQVRERAQAREVRALVVRSGKPGSFIAGADLDAIRGIEDPVAGEEAARLGQSVFMELERLPVPSTCAIDGICLGGGTEMALACTYRLASESDRTRIGLPEVQLGFLPAWGGTTRLPRLLGLQAALDLLLTGKTLSGSRARTIGLVDAVLPVEIFERTVREFVLARLSGGPIRTGARRSLFRRLGEDTAPGRKVILAAARRRVMDRTRGQYPAPLKILEVVRRSVGKSVDAALRIEAAAAGELLVSGVSKNLIHVFDLREGAKKLPAAVAPAATPEAVTELGVVGAGVMGGGIAQLAAYHDVRVRLKDIRHEAVAAGLHEARNLFAEAVKRHRLTRLEADQRMELISGGLTYDGFGAVDLVVEAVIERMDVKEAVLLELQSHVPDSCVLATNTSSLSVDRMASVLKRPERFCGMHFFNPVHRMPLVEVVRGAKTAPAVLSRVHAFARALGKVPVIVGDGPGFLVNRILGPYLNEAGWLLSDGVPGPAIDQAAVSFGMPMGPLRLLDEVGIDVAGHAGATLHEAFGDRMTPAPALLAIGESDRVGRKGGLGFYRYQDGKDPVFDPAVYGVLGDAVGKTDPAPDPRAIRARLVLAMINEAARTLEDGIAACAGDVDLAMIMGTGFPPFRGGILRYADHLHLKTILDRLNAQVATVGPRFQPSDLIVELAAADRGFYEAFPS